MIGRNEWDIGLWSDWVDWEHKSVYWDFAEYKIWGVRGWGGWVEWVYIVNVLGGRIIGGDVVSFKWVGSSWALIS